MRKDTHFAWQNVGASRHAHQNAKSTFYHNISGKSKKPFYHSIKFDLKCKRCDLNPDKSKIIDFTTYPTASRGNLLFHCPSVF